MRKSEGQNVIQRVVQLKRRLASNIARQNKFQWTHKLTAWCSRESKRSVSISPEGWCDDVQKVAEEIE